ncbi:iron-sulfur cluster assembly accessory protein [Leptolyngbya sp. FACHB-1515]
MKRLQRRCSDGNSLNAILRLGVQSGGCSDFYYTLEFVAAPAVGDRLWQCEDLQVAVDAHSLPYLNGLTVDYSEDLMGGGFRFDNPNAEQHCGCGNSFKAIELSKH